MIIEKTFTFEDDFNPDNKTKCVTKISVEDKISNNTPIYYINYTHRIIDNEKEYSIVSPEDVVNPCPFASLKGVFRDSFEGEILVKNEMTTNMINYMMMDDEELEKHIGGTTAQFYRKNIMITLSLFFD